MFDTTIQIKQTIAKTLGVEIDRVTDDALLVSDLGADSLDMAELAMALQEEYGAELSDEQMAQIHTVGHVIAAIGSTNKTV